MTLAIGCLIKLAPRSPSKPAHRQAALKLIKDTKPAVIVLSPPCCVFSPLRNLTNYKRDAAEVQEEEQQGRLHLDFAVSLAFLQLRNGRGFVFEHPKGAKSWRTETLQSLAQHREVFSIQLDMCAFGLHGGGGLRKKPTLVLTNIEPLVRALSKRCDQQHSHQPIEGGSLSRASAHYTDAFVDAILKGIRKYVHFEALHVPELEDSWSRPQGDVCCRHFRPRCSPPHPRDSGYDISKISFTGKRVITKRYLDGVTKVIEDDFRSTTSSPDAQPWTGTTWFETHKNVMLPQSLRDLAAWLTKSLSRVLFEYQHQQVTFSAEYMLAFPSHRILGGSVRDRRSAGAATTTTTTITPSSAASPSEQMLPEERPDYDDPEYSPDEAEDNDEAPGDEEKVAQELRDVSIDRPEEPPLAPELRRELYRVHRNLGDPDTQSFCRALKHAGVKPSPSLIDLLTSHGPWVLTMSLEWTSCTSRRRSFSTWSAGGRTTRS